MKAFLLPVLMLLAGVVAGAIAVGTSSSPKNPVASVSSQPVSSVPGTRSDLDLAHYAEIVDSLSELLNLEVMERRRLESELEALSSQVEEMTDNLAAAQGETPNAREERRKAQLQRRQNNDEEDRVNRFIEAGFEPERAAYLKRRQDELAMERLFLRDRARREGWLGSARFSEAMREMNEDRVALREELGESDYDRYLYATGRPNRVVVRSVLESSPAMEAGLQPGDALLSYNGSRVFAVSELVNATSEGNFGSTTAVEVLRDGQSMLVYVPRGPLGVNLGPTLTRPDG